MAFCHSTYPKLLLYLCLLVVFIQWCVNPVLFLHCRPLLCASLSSDVSLALDTNDKLLLFNIAFVLVYNCSFVLVHCYPLLFDWVYCYLLNQLLFICCCPLLMFSLSIVDFCHFHCCCFIMPIVVCPVITNVLFVFDCPSLFVSFFIFIVVYLLPLWFSLLSFVFNSSYHVVQ